MCIRDRLVAVDAGGQAGEAAGVPAALAARRLPFQIVASAERLVAGAGDDRDPLFRVGGEVVEYPVQFEMRIRMQRVVNLRARQRHDRDRALARDYRKFQVHVCSRGFFLWRGKFAPILACSRRPMPSNYAGNLRVTGRIPVSYTHLTLPT